MVRQPELGHELATTGPTSMLLLLLFTLIVAVAIAVTGLRLWDLCRTLPFLRLQGSSRGGCECLLLFSSRRDGLLLRDS